MATTLTINQIKAALGWDYEKVLAFGNASTISSFSFSKTLANGTGSGAATKLAVIQADGSSGGNPVLAASASDNYDLSALVDPFGTALNFTLVRALYLENLSANTGTVINLAGGASNPWVGSVQPLNGTTPALRVYANGVLLLATTVAAAYVVDSTHKTFKITNEDAVNSAKYKLIIVGE
jgi:hypothetical protein